MIVEKIVLFLFQKGNPMQQRPLPSAHQSKALYVSFAQSMEILGLRTRERVTWFHIPYPWLREEKTHHRTCTVAKPTSSYPSHLRPISISTSSLLLSTLLLTFAVCILPQLSLALPSRPCIVHTKSCCVRWSGLVCHRASFGAVHQRSFQLLCRARPRLVSKTLPKPPSVLHSIIEANSISISISLVKHFACVARANQPRRFGDWRNTT